MPDHANLHLIAVGPGDDALVTQVGTSDVVAASSRRERRVVDTGTSGLGASHARKEVRGGCHDPPRRTAERIHQSILAYFLGTGQRESGFERSILSVTV